MKGSRPGHHPPPTPSTDGARTCAHPGCETNLSMYNPRKHCWQHTDVVFPNYRGKRLSPGSV